MNREDQHLEQQFGRRTPFRVPEGYFDGLASQILQNLPEPEEQQARVVRHSFWYGRKRTVAVAAASIGLAILGLGRMVQSDRRAAADMADAHASASVPSEYSAFKALEDYTMLDTEDMYAYMEDYNR